MKIVSYNSNKGTGQFPDSCYRPQFLDCLLLVRCHIIGAYGVLLAAR